jgi:ferric-dicitrate binding protein FerR (iron transport regulator)
MEYKNHIEELLVRFIAGKLNDPEIIEVKNWIEGSIENRQYFEEMKKYYQLTKLVKKPGVFNLEEGWQRVKAGYNQIYLKRLEDRKFERRILIRRYLVPVAASILFAFIIGALFNQVIINKKADHSLVLCEINAPLGSQSQVRLPDGSVVWLNAGSKLGYYNNSFIKNRLVMLEGEAYFDVSHKDNRQFVVRTSDVDVKVYGTQFNVKSYPEESEITTTLVSGKVALERNRSSLSESVFLAPNQTAVINKSKIHNNKDIPLSECLQIEGRVNTQRITSWKDKRWYIGGETLDKLAVKLERRFNIRIIFEDESIKKYKFSGMFDDETFDQIMEIMEASSPIRYEMKKNVVIFRADKSYKEDYERMLNIPKSKN